jgi:hypothetical protein
LADTQKAKLDLDPIAGAEIEKPVRELLSWSLHWSAR